MSDSPLPSAPGSSGSRASSMRERMEAGELYLADDAELQAMQHRAQELLVRYNATAGHEVEQRQALLGEMLGAVGHGVDLRAPLHLDYGTHLQVGNRVFANFGLVVLDVAEVVIGDDVQMGPYVQLLTATHPLDPVTRRAKWEYAEPITIGDNVWLSGGVIVCPGVSIGDNTVVGAGSVVTGDLPADCLAVGSPARVVRTLKSAG